MVEKTANGQTYKWKVQLYESSFYSESVSRTITLQSKYSARCDLEYWNEQVALFISNNQI